MSYKQTLQGQFLEPEELKATVHGVVLQILRLGTPSGPIAGPDGLRASRPAFPCHRGQKPYKARIRSPRPGAERTVSAISYQVNWCGRASRSVVPCSRLLELSPSPFRRSRRA